MNLDKTRQRENNICANPKAEGEINCLEHFRDKTAITCKNNTYFFPHDQHITVF